MNAKPVLSAGAVIVRRFDSHYRYLLLRVRDYWDFPKGMVEPGEAPLAAAIRETEEETTLTDLDFRFREAFAVDIPDSYQRLLLDVLAGDPSLFARSDEVELAWGIIDPIATAWEEQGLPKLALYEAGQWGPPTAAEWMHRQGREWFDTCPVLH